MDVGKTQVLTAATEATSITMLCHNHINIIKLSPAAITEAD
jgi:hypothetical protein